MGEHLKVECLSCIGGTNVHDNIVLLKDGAHVLVGTPGRVGDMIGRRHLSMFCF